MALQIIAGLLTLSTYSSGTDSLAIGGLTIHPVSFYALFVLFWIVGFSNAVNLTDGIDGLASISVVISLIAYGIIAFVKGAHLDYHRYHDWCSSGFFVFNHKPAKVFMRCWFLVTWGYACGYLYCPTC